MKYKNVIVTGGAGQVGRHLQQIMPDAIYLSSKDYDLTKEADVDKMFFNLNPDLIIHCSAKVGGVISNIASPAEYFTQNILMNTLLVDYAYKNGVKRFIGLLSSCIYPDVHDTYPMLEIDMHNSAPTKTNFEYGIAKRALGTQIDAYNKQYKTKYQYLIPGNLYGEFDKYGENSHFIAALIKKIHHAKISNSNKIVLYGDGTPMRQFLHSSNLAEIIKYCIEHDIYENMNVVGDDNLTIKEMAEIALKACDAEHLKIEFDSTFPNGQFRKDVSMSILKSVIPDFKPMGLYEGIKKTYEYLVEHKTLDK